MRMYIFFKIILCTFSFFHLGALLGAIPKGSKRTQQEIHEDKPVLWIQLSDFSGNFSENLSHAVDTLIHKVSKVSDLKFKHITILFETKLLFR